MPTLLDMIRDAPELTNNDKGRGIKLPTNATPELAYLCGVLIGDGHLRCGEESGRYFIKCVGHPTDEKDFYNDVIKPLFKEVFGIILDVKLYDGGTTYGFQLSSKSIVRFLCENIGIPSGAKSAIITIPEIFKKPDNLMRAFICGYADTDFSLTLKRRYRDIQYYPVIIGSSKSKKIMKEIADYLKTNGITVHRDLTGLVMIKELTSILPSTGYKLMVTSKYSCG